MVRGKKFSEAGEERNSWETSTRIRRNSNFNSSCINTQKKSIKLILLYVMSSTHFTENSDDFQQPELKFETIKLKRK